MGLAGAANKHSIQMQYMNALEFLWVASKTVLPVCPFNYTERNILELVLG